MKSSRAVKLLFAVLLILIVFKATATETTWRHPGFEVTQFDINFSSAFNQTNIWIQTFGNNTTFNSSTAPLSSSSGNTTRATQFFDTEKGRLVVSENGSLYDSAGKINTSNTWTKDQAIAGNLTINSSAGTVNLTVQTKNNTVAIRILNGTGDLAASIFVLGNGAGAIFTNDNHGNGADSIRYDGSILTNDLLVTGNVTINSTTGFGKGIANLSIYGKNNTGVINAINETGALAAGVFLLSDGAGFLFTRDKNGNPADSFRYDGSQITNALDLIGLASGTGDALCITTAGTSVRRNTGLTSCAVSSELFKTNITNVTAPINSSMMSLHPIRYQETDTQKYRYGLRAEEVAIVYPELVGRDENGTVRGVRYEEFTALLLKVVQEQQVKINDLTNITTRICTNSPALCN